MKYIIETVGLTKKFGKQYGVRDLSLHVPEGKIYGLLGRNGAGKTTAMRMLLNLARPTSGEVFLFGENHKAQSKIYKKIGSVIESPGFYGNLTASENLKILATLRGKHRKDSISHALEIVGLHTEEKKPFSKYSLGMKQRLGIAAAIMHEPQLLILDEPINGLDPIGIHEIRKFFLSLCKENGTTILLSSHVLSEIEQLADIIGVMHEGRLLEEVNVPELRRRNRQYAEFSVSDVNTAAMILEREFRLTDYTVCDDSTIRIFDLIKKRGEINSRFVSQNLIVKRIYVSEEKLEEYFSSLIGGGGIA